MPTKLSAHARVIASEALRRGFQARAESGHNFQVRYEYFGIARFLVYVMVSPVMPSGISLPTPSRNGCNFRDLAQKPGRPAW